MANPSEITGGNSRAQPMRVRETVVRRRIFQACDACRQRKIRCDGSKPSCEWCSHHGILCTYMRRHRKKREELDATRFHTWKTHVNADLRQLHQALAETTQKFAYLNATFISDPNLREQQHAHVFEVETHHPPNPPPIPPRAVSHDWGSNAGVFSLYKGLPFFSSECQGWVELRAGERIKGEEFFQSQMWEYEPPSLVSIQSQGDLVTLPPRAELERCLTIFHFTGLSTFFPVIEVGTLPSMIDAVYNRMANVDVYACVYALVTFAAGYMEEAPSSMDFEACEGKVRLVIPILLLQRPTVESLQTMLILALCQMMHGNFQAVDRFIAIAARMLYVLGGYRPSKSHVRTLFWVCYILDKDLSLRMARLPVICDDQCDLTLPPGYNEHTVHLPAAEQPFWTDLRLSIIKSKAYNTLYSARALIVTDTELIKAIRELGKELDDWRLGLPVAHRPAFAEPSELACKEFRWILMHLDYHHCVTMVHQASSRCTQWSESQTHVLGVESSFEICVAASRSSLHHLLKASQIYVHVPNFWVVIFYPMSASISLFCNVLLDPLNPRAADDLALISRAPASIFQLSTKQPSRKEMAQYDSLIRFIAELSRLASQAIQNAHAESLNHRDN